MAVVRRLGWAISHSFPPLLHFQHIFDRENQRLGLPGPYELHPREYYTYQLRGVVVHTGTANQGHYFSYIRDPHLGAAAAAAAASQPSTCAKKQTRIPPRQSGCAESTAVGAKRTDSLADCVDRGSVEVETERADGGVGVDGAAGSAFSEGVACLGDKKCSGAGAAAGAGVKQTWCEFNDTIVKEWGVDGRQDSVEGAGNGGRVGGLEMDCFGGQQTMQVRVVGNIEGN